MVLTFERYTMKKLLITALFLVAGMAKAATTVPIVWPFSPASNQANALRMIINNANKLQDKYTFVFESKPGAGGSIAVNHVINHTTPALTMISTSVFTRVKYFPNESFDLEQLQPVAITSTDSPMVLLSKSLDFNDLKTKKSISVGILNGSVTESMAKTIDKKYGNIMTVPYPGTLDATRDAMGGHIDASVEFIKDALPWVESGQGRIIGVSGTKDIGKHKSFQSMGIPGMENLVANYYMLANKNMDDKLVMEFHNIITKAMIQQNVLDIWKDDHARVDNRTYMETVKFWNDNKAYWKK